MRKFVTSTICRRRALLEYFGEVYSPPTATSITDIPKPCCDNCLNNTIPEAMDLTDEVKLLLNVVQQTGECHGINLPIEVLVGQCNKRTESYTTLSIFGSGCHHGVDWWKALFWMLIDEGYLVEILKDTGKHTFLHKNYRLGVSFDLHPKDIEEVRSKTWKA
eukprot:TRINITY_DN731_c0_g2_i4.p2 TRINITY_DN731_c0_g2~~TRINITY_DN731_c0_g2_i4.p2  ORF type:complete len:162 (-),score=29.50 TRINITY_DN731_c0_g2_i4:224-709(-)